MRSKLWKTSRGYLQRYKILLNSEVYKFLNGMDSRNYSLKADGKIFVVK